MGLGRVWRLLCCCHTQSASSLCDIPVSFSPESWQCSHSPSLTHREGMCIFFGMLPLTRACLGDPGSTQGPFTSVGSLGNSIEPVGILYFCLMLVQSSRFVVFGVWFQELLELLPSSLSLEMSKARLDIGAGTVGGVRAMAG